MNVASIIRSRQVHDLEVLRLFLLPDRYPSSLHSKFVVYFFAFGNTCHVLNENYKFLFPQEY